MSALGSTFLGPGESVASDLPFAGIGKSDQLRCIYISFLTTDFEDKKCVPPMPSPTNQHTQSTVIMHCNKELTGKLNEYNRNILIIAQGTHTPHHSRALYRRNRSSRLRIFIFSVHCTFPRLLVEKGAEDDSSEHSFPLLRRLRFQLFVPLTRR